jgi:Phosphoesterase family
VMRIPNDHTSGLSMGKISPLSAAADNDSAMGMIIEGISHSKLWASTAVFVVEDDAQNGPDHVDAHRSPAFVLSPYTRGGKVDSEMYNQTSVLRSIEAILGLRPMTQFDAASRTMFGSFSTKPDLTPFVAEKPRTSLTQRNLTPGPEAKRSGQMDFEEADRIDDDDLNEILWRAIKKTDPPAPVRSAFSR